MSAERKFSISGRVFDATTEQALKNVRVSLLKIGASSGLFELPEITRADEIVTDSSGVFVFNVVARRGVILEIYTSGEKRADRFTVPLKKINAGIIRVDVRVRAGKAEIRWNDDDWITWKVGKG